MNGMYADSTDESIWSVLNDKFNSVERTDVSSTDPGYKGVEYIIKRTK